jgi:DNA sulfur modification protein DndD
VLNEKEQLIEQEQKAYESTKIILSESSKKIDQLTNSLNAQGGTWAASREKEIHNLSGLSKEKEIIQNQIREGLSGSFPFSIAPDFVQSCLNQLNKENELKRKKTTAEFLSKHLVALENRLLQSMDQDVFHHVQQEMHREFSDLLTPRDNTILIHDISDSLHKKIEATALNAINTQGKLLAKLADQLTSINYQIDSAGVNIARAPEEGLLTLRLEELNKEQDKKTQSTLKASQHKENIKGYLREAMDTVRLLDKYHTTFMESDRNNRALDYAYKAKNSLAEFAQRVSIMKIKDVENEFINSFKRLARKGDISIRAKIEPETFAIKIFDNFNNEITKNDLSSGEKQIYAIAILEALAKTSGRKLPIIIDTPLGRLDSKHRKKLVENYFPTASHQVIILSTDTEIDENFHKSLYEHISHTIKLDYEESIASTIANEGYFWPTAQAV